MRYSLLLLPLLCSGCGHAVVSEKLLDAALQGQTECAKSQVEVLARLANLQSEVQAIARRKGEPKEDLVAAITAQTRLLEELISLQNQAQVTTTRQTNQGDEQVKYAQAQLERLEQLHRQQTALHKTIEALTAQQTEYAKEQTASLMKLAELAGEIHAEMQITQSQAERPKDCLIRETACMCNETDGQNACR